MTDFDKVRNYYKYFDEENRLKWDASGKLEYEMTIRILDKYLVYTKDFAKDEDIFFLPIYLVQFL